MSSVKVSPNRLPVMMSPGPGNLSLEASKRFRLDETRSLIWRTRMVFFQQSHLHSRHPSPQLHLPISKWVPAGDSLLHVHHNVTRSELEFEAAASGAGVASRAQDTPSPTPASVLDISNSIGSVRELHFVAAAVSYMAPMLEAVYATVCGCHSPPRTVQLLTVAQLLMNDAYLPGQPMFYKLD